MNERIALDSSVAIELMAGRLSRPPLAANQLVLPLAVLGELRFGVLNAPAHQRSEIQRALGELLSETDILLPDTNTADYYARARGHFLFPTNVSRRRESSLLNDLWIAALCLQHELPLLTNDHDFDRIEGLHVIHW